MYLFSRVHISFSVENEKSQHPPIISIHSSNLLLTLCQNILSSSRLRFERNKFKRQIIRNVQIADNTNLPNEKVRSLGVNHHFRPSITLKIIHLYLNRRQLSYL
jgi:hypothetical protein